METKDYTAEHLQQLMGKRVTAIAKDDTYEDHCGESLYGLIFDDNTVAWILMDPEGNGPGHLNIGPLVRGK